MCLHVCVCACVCVFILEGPGHSTIHLDKIHSHSSTSLGFFLAFDRVMMHIKSHVDADVIKHVH